MEEHEIVTIVCEHDVELGQGRLVVMVETQGVVTGVADDLVTTVVLVEQGVFVFLLSVLLVLELYGVLVFLELYDLLFVLELHGVLVVSVLVLVFVSVSVETLYFVFVFVVASVVL